MSTWHGGDRGTEPGTQVGGRVGSAAGLSGDTVLGVRQRLVEVGSIKTAEGTGKRGCILTSCGCYFE